jgi:Ca2+-transporting ATPase
MTSVEKPASAGLTETEAARRLAAEGPNELPSAKRRSIGRIILEVAREPMLALLVLGCVIYLLLGDRTESLMLLAFATLSIVITVVQQSRAERVLDALRDMTSPRALVIRDGVRRRIAGREVVRADLIALCEGDRVPADARLLEAPHFEADESLLTGESQPIAKGERDTVFSGSLVVRGSGIAEVFATGGGSEIGKIGQSLETLDPEPPRMQREMRRLVRVFAIIAGVASLAAVILYGALRGDWFDALLAGIALGMSLLPEEFPVVLTVFLAMGAWRISQARVLTRRAAAIETLGAATVLCTDKTGTLTVNRMSVEAIAPRDEVVMRRADSTASRLMLETAVLASAPSPFDPMEMAFHRAAEEARLAKPEGAPARIWGLTRDFLAVTQAWPLPDGAFVIATKGAPETIASLARLDDHALTRMRARVEEMAETGLRLIAVARARSAGPLPDDLSTLDFDYLGLAGLADPLRDTAADAVAECRAAGVRVVMITGDHPATARTIAAEAGIDGAQVVSGEAIAVMTDDELADAARCANVFARVRPDQKLRIVSVLKRDAEIVAMTGDGVNDAPALKAAHIGIAMGGRGTDVAREASAIVLLDDDFRSIVTTLKLGRRIHDNLRKASAFIFAVHVPIAGMALLPLLTGFPVVLGPVHIAFLEMVIDPVCSLVLEAEKEEPDIMRRPPRTPTEPLVTRRLVLTSLAEGFLAFLLVSAIYVGALVAGFEEGRLRALTFIALVTVVFSLILANRAYSASLVRAVFGGNVALLVVAVVVGALLALMFVLPGARELFDFGALGAVEAGVALLTGAVSLFTLELMTVVIRVPPNRRAAPQ